MKVAIIGCGNIAKYHIAAISGINTLQLVGVCDTNEYRAVELGDRYAVPHFKELDRLFEQTMPDVVHILTPPQTHAGVAVKALQRGCHVFIEKPLCISSGEVAQIEEAAKRSGKKVCVDHSLLYHPLVEKVMRVFNTGDLGEIIKIDCVMGDDYNESLKSGYGRWALDLPLGIFSDLLPHPLYIIQKLLPESKILDVHAKGKYLNRINDLWIKLTAKDALASLWLSLDQRPLEYSMQIYCTAGIIKLDLRNQNLVIIKDRGLPGPITRILYTFADSYQRSLGTTVNSIKYAFGRFSPYDGTKKCITAFYKAIIEQTEPPVNLAAGRKIVELSEKICKALQEQGFKSDVDKDEYMEDISGKSTILVTGGTGFIGSHLVKKLVGQGKYVRILARLHASLEHLPKDKVELLYGDITDIDVLKRALKGIEVVYHLAANMGGDWGAHYQNTVIGTKNLFELASNASVGKILYVSSLGVLKASSFPNNSFVNESFPLENNVLARGYYSRAKLEAEKIAIEHSKLNKVNIIIIRPGLVYGPENSDIVSDAAFKFSKGIYLTIGMGRRRLALVYVDNLVDALVASAGANLPSGTIYNVVDKEQPTVRKYLDAYRHYSGRKLVFIYLPILFWVFIFRLLDSTVKCIKGNTPNYLYRLRSIIRSPVFDTAKIQKDIGWEGRVDFESAMQGLWNDGD